jgi:hypothetical protein
MNVWLITIMQSYGCTIWDDARNLKFVTLLHGRLGEKRVGSLVELFYASEILSLGDLVETARTQPRHGIRSVKVRQGIICGENPFVFARKVELVDIRRENGIEKLIWKEQGVVRAMKRWEQGLDKVTRRKMTI